MSQIWSNAPSSTDDVTVKAPEPVVHAGRRWLLSPWAATVTATAASTYALDGVATAAGVLLVASHALGGLGHWHALVFLAATYAAWGAGLRANLRANWSLLEQTGMSTNALSKAAHDLTRFRSTSDRDRRIASAAGYLGLELAKEAPYYAGAFGAAVLSDSVSSTDAIVFLAGTNLGAAGYEYALARITRSVLRRRSPQACASFDTDPVPRAYLAEHYSRVEPDEARTSNASNRSTSLGRHDQDDDRRRSPLLQAGTASQSSAPHPRSPRFGDGPPSEREPDFTGQRPAAPTL
jgi:hypothetical protein